MVRIVAAVNESNTEKAIREATLKEDEILVYLTDFKTYVKLPISSPTYDILHVEALELTRRNDTLVHSVLTRISLDHQRIPVEATNIFSATTTNNQTNGLLFWLNGCKLLFYRVQNDTKRQKKIIEELQNDLKQLVLPSVSLPVNSSLLQIKYFGSVQLGNLVGSLLAARPEEFFSKPPVNAFILKIKNIASEVHLDPQQYYRFDLLLDTGISEWSDIENIRYSFFDNTLPFFSRPIRAQIDSQAAKLGQSIDDWIRFDSTVCEPELARIVPSAQKKILVHKAHSFVIQPIFVLLEDTDSLSTLGGLLFFTVKHPSSLVLFVEVPLNLQYEYHQQTVPPLIVIQPPSIWEEVDLYADQFQLLCEDVVDDKPKSIEMLDYLKRYLKYKPLDCQSRIVDGARQQIQFQTIQIPYVKSITRGILLAFLKLRLNLTGRSWSATWGMYRFQSEVMNELKVALLDEAFRHPFELTYSISSSSFEIEQPRTDSQLFFLYLNEFRTASKARPKIPHGSPVRIARVRTTQ